MKKTVDFENSETKINLARSFAGECQDGARYQFLAQQAMREGYFYLQTLLKTLAKNEMAHAKVFYNLIVNNCAGKQCNIDITAGYPFGAGTICESLVDSIQTEVSQAENIYPDFAKTAKDEGFEEAAKRFELTATVENCHQLLLSQILEKMNNNELYKSPTPIKWKCSNCGFEHTSKAAWETCPSCDAEQGYVQIPIDTNSQ